MKAKDAIAWIGFIGALAAVIAAATFDFRAGVFVAGVILWMDAR